MIAATLTAVRGRVWPGAWVLGLWAALGVGLSLITTRVGDWFDMTDEMRYERLAIAIARNHSLNPQIHGVQVENWSQLYPLVIAPAFARGHVPHDLWVAHLTNAWLMSSACVPAYLLARRVTRRRWVGFVVAALSVSIPWILYATMLMTEVAAYPVFLWAAYAFQRAIDAPSPRNDLLALAVAPIAYFARTPLLIVAIILPVAVVVFELGRSRRPVRGHLAAAVRAHWVLVAGYLGLGIACLVLKIEGDFSTIFGLYGYYATNQPLLGHGFVGALADHVSTFSLGIGVLPFLVGFAWLLANCVRPPKSRELHAFACIGAVSVVAIGLQASAFDLRYANYVHDRFMLYLAPLLVLGTICALLDNRAPRWSLLVPCGLVVLGFAVGSVNSTAWQHDVPIDPDNPAELFFKPFVALAHGLGNARVLLALATVALAGLFIAAAAKLRKPYFVAAFVALLAFGLPAETGYAFTRLFGVKGPSGRPLTVNMTGRDDWVDQVVGSNADVTILPYPVSTDYNLNTSTWQDYEFWNKSVDRDLQYAGAQIFEPTGFWFPKEYVHYDPTSGALGIGSTPYLLAADQESRLRVSGQAIAAENGVTLIKADTPWRLDWLTFGLYVDGWTKPHVTTRIRIFPSPGQRTSHIRYVNVAFRTPGPIASRPVTVSSNAGRWTGNATNVTTRAQVEVCLPANRFTEVRVRTPDSSAIPPDLSNGVTEVETNRQGGIFISEIDLADEVGPACS